VTITNKEKHIVT